METTHACQRCTEASVGPNAKPSLAQRRIQRAGMADVSGQLRPIEEISAGGFGAWRTGGGEEAELAERVRHDAALEPGVLCAVSESAGQLRGRGVVHKEQRQRLWPGRPARHSAGR